jgi:cytochrome c biogenesis protein CcdA
MRHLMSNATRWTAALLLLALVVCPQFATAQSADNLRWSASFSVEDNGIDGLLQVSVEIEAGYHIYGSNPIHGEIPTKLSLPKDFADATVVGPFEPDSDPITVFDLEANRDSTHYEGFVTWTAPLKLAEGVDPQSLTIPINASGQICLGVLRCNTFKVNVEATLTAAAVSGALFPSDAAHATFQGTLTPRVARPGQTIQLRLEAKVENGWTITPTAAATVQDSAPNQTTILLVNKSNGWIVGNPVLAKEATPEHPVWLVSIDVPRNTTFDAYSLGGVLGVQAQGESGPAEPTSIAFKADLSIASSEDAEPIAVSFEAGPSYQQVRDLFVKHIEARASRAGQFANYSLPTVFGLALLAGFILNFMPCVLPVIGLKIMSFVHQAGQDSRRIFLFNLAFALGILSIFMLLAFVASQPSGGGWGGLFQSNTFQIVMIGVVFAFALSFLGVWEIPIPGMSGAAGKLASREGLFGAFLKGIITTLLATPCSGPLLVPTVIWALAQPPLLTYLTFGAMGLGMALPYLLIGAFPKLIGLLPRPGNWMVTFKHLMGFAMLGAAIFLFNSLKEQYQLPTLTMALVIGMACSVIGKTSVAAEFLDKLKAWTFGTAIVALGCWFSFYVLVPAHQLPWDPFSRVVLEEKLKEGNVVFVDFTADW